MLCDSLSSISPLKAGSKEVSDLFAYGWQEQQKQRREVFEVRLAPLSVSPYVCSCTESVHNLHVILSLSTFMHYLAQHKPLEITFCPRFYLIAAKNTNQIRHSLISHSGVVMACIK